MPASTGSSRSFTQCNLEDENVSEKITIQVIRKIKKSHENIMVFVGVATGILLIAYFFTFAQFFDRGMMWVVYFQAITSLMLVAGLFFLKRVSFFLIQRMYGGREPYKTFIDAIVYSDLDKDEQKLEEEFGSSGMHA